MGMQRGERQGGECRGDGKVKRAGGRRRGIVNTPADLGTMPFDIQYLT